MIADTAATDLQQHKLLTARSNLAKRLGKASHIEGKLRETQSKLLGISQKLPLLCDAMASIGSHVVYESGLASRLDVALEHATAVLDIFTSIHTTERKLRNEDPRHDLQRYLAMVCCMERYLHMLQDAYGPSLHWLEDVIGYLNQSQALVKDGLSTLTNELQQLKGLDPDAINNGGLLSISLSKLEDEFGRLLEENCVVVDLSAHVNSSGATNSPLVIIKQDAIIHLLVIADRLRANGRLDKCLQLYREARGKMVKKSIATLKPEYLRYASADALRGKTWEKIHRFLYAWLRDFTVVVRVLMVSERELCNQLFPTLDPSSEWTKLFEEVMQESKFPLYFRFAEEVARSQHRPEALLVGLLDLVKGLGELEDDMSKVFDACVEMLANVAFLQKTLMQNIRRAFWELVKNVETRQSDVPNNGGKDPNASFVVNYMGMLLRNYAVTMELAFTSQDSADKEGEIVEESSLHIAATSIMGALEKSLEGRASTSYNDPVLAHVFLMNNYRHVLVRLKEWEGLSNCVGEDFKVQWKKKVDHNMRGYLKKAWEKVMMLLSRENLQLENGGRGVCKDAVRSRLRAFNAAFDEIYKQQCRWVILDGLRDSVQLAIIQLLVPAYHSFVLSLGALLEEGTYPHKRVIKYSGDMLQNMVQDMFEGKQPHFLALE